jgi:uncharacterized protein YneF (UPF0154 family)
MSKTQLKNAAKEYAKRVLIASGQKPSPAKVKQVTVQVVKAFGPVLEARRKA